jgi:anaerobic selenocysteine-containing dehydrogenase
MRSSISLIRAVVDVRILFEEGALSCRSLSSLGRPRPAINSRDPRDSIEAAFPDFADFNARIKKPGGFRLYVAASECEWLTPTKKAKFLVYPGLDEDPRVAHDEILTLTTIRSHDQYNTTIYGMNDRYRGITGRRDVVFVNERDLSSRGLKHGDLVDIAIVPGEKSKSGQRVMRNLTAVAYDIAQGSVAAHYPEAECPGCARALRRKIRNAFLQVDAGSAPRFGKLDVECVVSRGKYRSLARVKKYIVYGLCGDGIPRELWAT